MRWGLKTKRGRAPRATILSAAGRRRVLLKVHTLLKWRNMADKLLLRAATDTAVMVMYAYWNPETRVLEQEKGKGAWCIDEGRVERVERDARNLADKQDAA